MYKAIQQGNKLGWNKEWEANGINIKVKGEELDAIRYLRDYYKLLMPFENKLYTISEHFSARKSGSEDVYSDYLPSETGLMVLLPKNTNTYPYYKTSREACFSDDKSVDVIIKYYTEPKCGDEQMQQLSEIMSFYKKIISVSYLKHSKTE